MAEPLAGDVLPASVAVDKLPAEKTLCPEFTPSLLGFPTEFPFEFNSPTFSSAFPSPGDSTETEDESSDDEEDFLAGLTRRLALSTQRLPHSFSSEKAEEKRRVVSTSPLSTLSGLGSWSASGNGSPNGPLSHVPSPPATPFRKDDTWDVISAAAGQVARLKMGDCREPLLSRPNPNPNLNAAFSSDIGFQQFYSHSNQSAQVDDFSEESAGIWRYANWPWHPKGSCYGSHLTFESSEQQAQRRASGVIGCENGRCVRPATWQRLQRQTSSAVRSVLPVGSAPKRSSAGTGVFLPRRYTDPCDSPKKLGGSSVAFPSKVVHPQNQTFDLFNDLYQPNSRPCLMSGHTQLDHESLMARRSDSLIRQGGRLRPPVHGGCLN
ncbi:PREDICTED: uncharacterized protein LOC104809429 [Tarenaya hassleriana]|uniref:uncharacterized protein LOC104809429 n=1 Tax=Tarenaya hassleriana TaxID=28532 RepID=UPI00053C65FE|nr:PREDICTED: uncharacterized protein LOC104809429 [Tarenaya hassleriana]